MPDKELPPDLAYWDGFEEPNYTQVPNAVFDRWLPWLSEAELKVLLYILRHTFGWQKDADAISISQMVNGIVARDGRRIDWGAGVSERSILRALPALQAKRLIDVEKRQAADGINETSVYRPRMHRGGGSRQFAGMGGDNLAGGVPAESGAQKTTNQNKERDRDQFATDEAVPSDPGPPPYSPYLAQVVLDHARELGAAPRGPAGVEQVLRLWQGSGQDEATFVGRLHAARDTVRQRQKPGADKWGLYLIAVGE